MKKCALLLLPLVIAPLQAQEGPRLLILSDRVGAEIDAAERQQFGLFKQFDFYVSGSFFQMPDSSFECRVIQGSSASPPETTWVRYQYPLLLMLAERIEHYDELKAGRYSMGSSPPAIRYASGEPVVFVSPPRATAQQEPESRPAENQRVIARVQPLGKYPDVFRYAVHYPHLGIGMGIMGGPEITGGNVYGEKLVQRIDARRTFLVGEVVIEFSRTMALSLLGATPVSRTQPSAGPQKASFGAVSFRYLYILSTVAALAEIGFVGMQYTLQDSPYGNGLDFDVSLRGIMLGAGVELNLSQSFSVLARARYMQTAPVSGPYSSLADGQQNAEIFIRAATYDLQFCYYY